VQNTLTAEGGNGLISPPVCFVGRQHAEKTRIPPLAEVPATVTACRVGGLIRALVRARDLTPLGEEPEPGEVEAWNLCQPDTPSSAPSQPTLAG
jgi:hypothetical protein